MSILPFYMSRYALAEHFYLAFSVLLCYRRAYAYSRSGMAQELIEDSWVSSFSYFRCARCNCTLTYRINGAITSAGITPTTYG